MEKAQQGSFDVVIAGGGLAGVLSAARLVAEHPHVRIALLDKEPELGGRIRSTSPDQPRFGYGLNALSDGLFEFLRKTLDAADPEVAAPEPVELGSRRQVRFGVLAAGKLAEAPIESWFTPKGARTLGGLTAARQWPEVETIVRQGAVRGTEDDDAGEEDGDDTGDETPAPKAARAQAFGHYWKMPRKVPAAVVLEHFGSAFGIPDVWGAAPEAIAERAAFHGSRLHCGVFDAALQRLTERPAFKAAVTVMTGTRIVDAQREGDEWVLTTEKGKVSGRSLIVAQPPWQATGWLRRTHWPAPLLQVASKTKPVSVVVLAERLLKPATGPVDLPDVILVPSERVQILRNGEGELSFQATIDYELSLQAPAVVKAVKSLKRARRKLAQLYPGIVSETNHIALQPVAWAQSPAQADRRWLSRLGKKSFNAPTLGFTGDAYGPAYDGDSNLVQSLVDACGLIGGDLSAVASAKADQNLENSNASIAQV